MKHTVWRIAKQEHARTALAGEGARLYGGRWNSPGTSIVYAAQSQSLALLEMLVHLESPELLKRYVLFKIQLEASLTTRLDVSRLPKNWKEYPVPARVQSIGDNWAASRASVALAVPSAVVPDESNFLLNPNHHEFSKLIISKSIAFQFDPRLAVKLR